MGGAENWGVKPAQIYSTVARLEKAGLVVEERVDQDSGPEKRVYAITPAGREALSDWFSTTVLREHERDEFFVKLMIGLASGAADPWRLLGAQRTHLYQELHAVTRRRTSADPRRELATILLLDQAAMHLEADLRWLDMTEARLDEILRQPLPQPEVKVRGRPRKTRP